MLSGTSSLLSCDMRLGRGANSIGGLGDVARDFVEMELHHGGVGVGQREGSPDAAGRADRAEQIGVVIALVGELCGPRLAPGPLPNLTVLLADAGLVLKPYLDQGHMQQYVEMSFQHMREVFLKDRRSARLEPHDEFTH